MSGGKIVDPVQVRALRRHEAAVLDIQTALGVLHEGSTSLHQQAEVIVAGLTRVTETMHGLVAESDDTLQFCRDCQQAWEETDLDALIRNRDRLVLELAEKKRSSPASDWNTSTGSRFSELLPSITR